MFVSVLVVQLMLWLLASPASPKSIDPLGLQCNGSSIPYPFGIINSSSPPLVHGFGILCDGGASMLPLPYSTPLKVVNISPHGQVRVLVEAIEWHCSHGHQEAGLPHQPISLEGTPYTFNDTANKFTVIGCDALALLDGSPQHNTSGCASFCYDMNNAMDGSCSGVGCCQASIPKGLKSFKLNFSSIRSLTDSPDVFQTSLNLSKNGDGPRFMSYHRLGGYVLEYPTCSKASILEMENFTFSIDDLRNVYDDKLRTVVLDWAIGTETCAEAQRNRSSYACKDSNSRCNDSASSVGYRCYCNEGYQGNPYLLDGCQDVDECSPPNINPCVSKCINTRGKFHCPCPFGTSGDGKIAGTGCKKVAPLEIALGVGLVFLIILLGGSSWVYWIWKKRKIEKLKEKFFSQNGGLLLLQRISSQQVSARIFSLEDLKKATEGFHQSRVIGSGGYGTVYKGILPDQTVIAIKKSKLVDEDQIEPFINEVVILSQIYHKNVVKLLGCCLESQVPMLVYEFISNGTLFHHVHEKGPGSTISWENRLRIATETAAALAYLHSATSPPIIHRDVKSANILLDEHYSAKVSDFGASRLVPYNHTHVTTLVQGTWGYLDPEYFYTSKLTDKSDVYSFGVVLVELLIREKPVSFSRSEGERNLASYFVSLVEEKRLLEVVDGQTIKEASVRHVSTVAELARKCLSLKGEERPTMKDVAVELDALRWIAEKQFLRPPPDEEELPVSASWDPHTGSKLDKYAQETYLLSS